MLIIYAHPNKEGHAGYALQTVQKHLDNKEIDYEVLDLYEMNYDPILKNEEHYTSGHYNITNENKKIQEKIKRCDKFIFIYPTWWQNMPAILKGFFDRILTPRFAYEFKNKIPVKLLRGRAIVITSTGGPRIYTFFGAGDRSVKVVTKDILNFCGIKTKAFIIGNADKLTDRQKKKIDRAVEAGMRFIS